MKKYLLLLLFCGLAALACAQAPDTTKKPSLPGDMQDLDVPAVDNSKIFTSVEVMPKYPGGIDSLYSYLAQHIVYPQIALDAHIGGIVRLDFVAEKDGSVSDVHVISSPNGRLSGEAIRVVSAMKLIPARQSGKLVRVESDISIRFDPANPHKFY
ncbi:MAG TPA: energy transducer TonB [Mucilaginibacter sp.]|jgi:protein TonB|nr:energy transducer TonB [Mucilaginibacter sp.]